MNRECRNTEIVRKSGQNHPPLLQPFNTKNLIRGPDSPSCDVTNRSPRGSDARIEPLKRNSRRSFENEHSSRYNDMRSRSRIANEDIAEDKIFTDNLDDNHDADATMTLATEDTLIPLNIPLLNTTGEEGVDAPSAAGDEYEEDDESGDADDVNANTKVSVASNDRAGITRMHDAPDHSPEPMKETPVEDREMMEATSRPSQDSVPSVENGSGPGYRYNLRSYRREHRKTESGNKNSSLKAGRKNKRLQSKEQRGMSSRAPVESRSSKSSISSEQTNMSVQSGTSAEGAKQKPKFVPKRLNVYTDPENWVETTAVFAWNVTVHSPDTKQKEQVSVYNNDTVGNVRKVFLNTTNASPKTRLYSLRGTECRELQDEWELRHCIRNRSNLIASEDNPLARLRISSPEPVERPRERSGPGLSTRAQLSK